MSKVFYSTNITKSNIYLLNIYVPTAALYDGDQHALASFHALYRAHQLVVELLDLLQCGQPLPVLEQALLETALQLVRYFVHLLPFVLSKTIVLWHVCIILQCRDVCVYLLQGLLLLELVDPLLLLQECVEISECTIVMMLYIVLCVVYIVKRYVHALAEGSVVILSHSRLG